jgi:hypothetical protein
MQWFIASSDLHAKSRFTIRDFQVWEELSGSTIAVKPRHSDTLRFLASSQAKVVERLDQKLQETMMIDIVLVLSTCLGYLPHLDQK